jgi:hypothetical protein
METYNDEPELYNIVGSYKIIDEYGSYAIFNIDFIDNTSVEELRILLKNAYENVVVRNKEGALDKYLYDELLHFKCGAIHHISGDIDELIFNMIELIDINKQQIKSRRHVSVEFYCTSDYSLK